MISIIILLNISQQTNWVVDMGSSLVGALAGALVGGYLTYIIGSKHLTKQLEVDKAKRKTDFIIRQLEYQRNRLGEIKSDTLNIYNKISHEVEYRKMIRENKHLAYDEKTNIVLFKDIDSLIVDYEQLDEANKHKDTKNDIHKIKYELEDILDNDFYSKMKLLTAYELKSIELTGKVEKKKDSLEEVGIKLIDVGLKEIDNFIDILNEDIKYVQHRLITEENNL